RFRRSGTGVLRTVGLPHGAERRRRMTSSYPIRRPSHGPGDSGRTLPQESSIMGGPISIDPVTIVGDQQQFLNLCAQANTKVDLAERRFGAWLSSVTLAYSQAWTKHTTFLKDAEVAARLTEDLILGAALAFFPGGVGGVVGSLVKDRAATMLV